MRQKLNKKYFYKIVENDIFNKENNKVDQGEQKSWDWKAVHNFMLDSWEGLFEMTVEKTLKEMKE